MKAVLVLLAVIVGVCLAERTAQEVAEVLNNNDLKRVVNYLPAELRRAITKRATEEHWCCNDGGHHLRPVHEHESRITVMYRRQSTEVTNDFHGCGLWGLGRCQMTNAKYHQVVEYGHRYLTKPVFKDCQTEVVCCDGYSLVGGNCIKHDHLIKHGDTIFAGCKLGIWKCPGTDSTQAP